MKFKWEPQHSGDRTVVATENFGSYVFNSKWDEFIIPILSNLTEWELQFNSFIRKDTLTSLNVSYTKKRGLTLTMDYTGKYVIYAER